MWKLGASERITRWRDFRKSLDCVPLEQAIAMTADFWQGCPFAPYYLDPDNLSIWPDPWQLISENYYCDIAKALGIVYTLYFTSHRDHLVPEIRIYYEPRSRYTYNLSVFQDGKYVLNFRDGEVVNTSLINKNLKLKHCYTSNDLKLKEY